MSKAEKFIQDYTRNCSNVVAYSGMIEGSELRYHEWLTPDQARKAVKITREETVNKVCDYIKDNLYKHLYIYDREAGFPTAQFINDLKQAMNDE